MNICYVVPDVVIPYFRGSSTHVREISRNLTKLGHRVFVISRRLNREQSKWEALVGFQTYRTFQGLFFEPPQSSYGRRHVDDGSARLLKRLYGWYLNSFRAVQLGVEIAAVMRARKIDVVLERETAYGAGAVCSILLRVPMVLEMVGPNCSRLSLKEARRILAYSSRMTRGRVSTEKIEIVSTGVDTDLFRPGTEGGPRLRKGLEMGEGPVIGYIGSFPRWHGVEDLIQACDFLTPWIPGVRLLLVGPYFEAAREFADRLNLGDRVRFTGPVKYEEVPDYVNACDIMCAPYNPNASKERSMIGLGAPLKVMEYMACGKPIISTLVEPIPSIMRDGVEGILVPPGNSRELGKAISMLSRDRELGRRMAESARLRALEEFSWDRITQKIVDVLEQASGKSYGQGLQEEARGGGVEN